MDNPLVSIIVCCYNRRHLLEQTMESIFSQQYKPVEIVVLDDGSTDDTPKLMQSYGERIRYYRQENQGVSSARTAACRLAKGEYIAFQDDDDLMPPDRIIQLYRELKHYPSAVLAVGDWEAIDMGGNLTGQRTRFNIHVDGEEPVLIKDGYRAVLWPEITPTPHTTLFRRIDGERIGWFDTRFFNAVEDTDFFARLGQLGQIVYVPKIVSYYRKGHSQMMGKNAFLIYNRFLLFEKHLKSINTEQRDLRKRLQVRILNTLKGIAFIQSNTTTVHDRNSGNYIDKGLSLLNIKGRIAYKWYTLLRLPIRRLVKGFPTIREKP
ncbi:MAG: glycosyltransferase family 2 protein [Candidatus Scalinduaceae bacterium]